MQTEGETKPTEPEVVNPPPADDVNPAQAGGGTRQGTEPNAAAAESALTAEQIADLRKRAQLADESQREITRQQQQNAELRRGIEQREAALMAAIGRQTQQATPLEQAEAEYERALETFDARGQRAALGKMLAVERQQLRSEVQRTVIDAINVDRGLREAADFGVTDPGELVRIHNTLTPKELALVAASRSGKLSDILDKQKSAQQKAADDAKRLDAILSGGGQFGGGRQVPGAINTGDDGVPEIPASLYYALPEASARKKWPNAKVVPG